MSALHDAIRDVVESFADRGGPFTNRECFAAIRARVPDAPDDKTLAGLLDDYCAFGTFLTDPHERARRHKAQLGALERLLGMAERLGVQDDERVTEGIEKRLGMEGRA